METPIPQPETLGYPPKKEPMNLKKILESIYPLHRTLVSDGTDAALGIIGDHMPPVSNYALETYPPGLAAWTWTIPERYVVHEAYLENEEGNTIVDFHENPLHLVSYSQPVDNTLSWEALDPHLNTNPERPDATPWVFKYYDRDWGFCLPHAIYEKLDRSIRYRAVIRSEFVTEPERGLRVGVGTIPPAETESGVLTAVDQPGEILIGAHICHPNQANDDAAGVVTALELARRLAENPLPAGSMAVRFLFCPETIGTIAYLSQHEDLIPRLKGGIFLEMTGNRGSLAWHHTRQHDHLLDRITRSVFEKAYLNPLGRQFAAAPANDERVINGPGVNVPCISLNRWPYDEYHTSDDNPDIIHEDMLQEAADTAEAIIRIYATNYLPQRTFKGPVFLSGHGLFVDWRENWDLNRALEQIMMSFEGDQSVFDIAEAAGLDYLVVRSYVEKFRAKGLVTALPIPGPGSAE